ncbi:MAG: S-layer homology domain-containing protein [Oculatellaceae cyanobacterium Prado106]|jgi:hypothetical protein|nr:S-layer homology domain-containing protein [Oculatellaceae cyanobacterium Prado106]
MFSIPGCMTVLLPKRLVLFPLLTLCVVLPSCANSPWAQNLEQAVAADPRLANNPVVFGNPQSATPSPTSTTAQLPANFPVEIPRYPNAVLVGVLESSQSFNGATSATTQTRWRTTDTLDRVEQFYRNQFQSPGWQVQGTTGAGQPIQAIRDGLQVQVSRADGSTVGTEPGTEFAIAYTLGSGTAIAPSPTPQTNQQANSPAGSVPQPGDPNFIGPVFPTNVAQSGSPSPSASPQNTTDISQAPAQLQPYITDLLNLGALPIRSGNANTNASNTTATAAANPSKFEPNKAITRREYARWLVSANNLIYGNQPARQIRLAGASDQPAFTDVPATDPDFGSIQGLATAGLLPSPLSGDSTAVTFRPDAPLTREDLLLWKVPVDLRRALPNATLDAVKETWGFQDTARIEPKALRAVLADYQNSDLSNIRRAFGYTTLFNPKKTVTRAEAAAVLWFFGAQGDGLSARDALQSGRSPAAGQSPASPTPSPTSN